MDEAPRAEKCESVGTNVSKLTTGRTDAVAPIPKQGIRTSASWASSAIPTSPALRAEPAVGGRNAHSHLRELETTQNSAPGWVGRGLKGSSTLHGGDSSPDRF